MTIDLDNNGNGRVYWSPEATRPTDTEFEIASLVFSACASYLLDDEKESMSYGECNAAAELAENRFDWSAAGYGEEGEEGERVFCLTEKIAHFEDL